MSGPHLVPMYYVFWQFGPPLTYQGTKSFINSDFIPPLGIAPDTK